jgi:hypothetical protein
LFQVSSIALPAEQPTEQPRTVPVFSMHALSTAASDRIMEKTKKIKLTGTACLLPGFF